jgi:hypothetical protein
MTKKKTYYVDYASRNEKTGLITEAAPPDPMNS